MPHALTNSDSMTQHVLPGLSLRLPHKTLTLVKSVADTSLILAPSAAVSMAPGS